MLKIAKLQYLKRWDVLPFVLREAMFSPANGDIIWRIGEEHHLKEEQIATIAGICGNIVMGFIHPEDLAKEIKTDLGIDERLAQAVAREISRKVFSPIRSEMDKVYSPPAPVVEEIRMPEIKETEEIKETKKESVPTGEIIPTEEKKINLEEFQVVGPDGEITKPAEEEIKETEKLIETEKPVESSAEIKPEPFILHQESELKPISETPKSFSLSRFFDFLKKKETKPAEAPSVVLEMGDEKIGDEKEEIKEIKETEKLIETEKFEEAPEIKVVDYTAEPPTNLPTTDNVQSITEKEEEKKEEEKKEDTIDLSSLEGKE